MGVSTMRMADTRGLYRLLEFVSLILCYDNIDDSSGRGLTRCIGIVNRNHISTGWW